MAKAKKEQDAPNEPAENDLLQGIQSQLGTLKDSIMSEVNSSLEELREGIPGIIENKVNELRNGFDEALQTTETVLSSAVEELKGKVDKDSGGGSIVKTAALGDIGKQEIIRLLLTPVLQGMISARFSQLAHFNPKNENEVREVESTIQSAITVVDVIANTLEADYDPTQQRPAS